LLRKNLNLLKDEFQAQLDRAKADEIGDYSINKESYYQTSKGKKDRLNKDFIDIFGQNNGGDPTKFLNGVGGGNGDAGQGSD